MEAELLGRENRLEDTREVVALRVIGRVRQPLVLAMGELRVMDTEQVRDLPIFCGSGTPKGRIESLRGVPLDVVIRRADMLLEDHNDTKKMLVVATALDGHKVVFSWQEIFNSPMGGGIMVLVEKDGRSLCEEPGCLELISTEDYFTGSRYVKGLATIELMMV